MVQYSWGRAVYEECLSSFKRFELIDGYTTKCAVVDQGGGHGAMAPPNHQKFFFLKYAF